MDQANKTQTESALSKLSPKQVKCIAALLLSPSLKQAAKKSGVAHSSIHQWLRQDDAFRQALEEAKSDAIERAKAALSGATCDAVLALRSVCRDTTAKSADRVAAARTILQIALVGMDGGRASNDMPSTPPTIVFTLSQAGGQSSSEQAGLDEAEIN